MVEDKANGSAVIRSLAHEIAGIIAVQPEGGKIARAYAICPLLEVGNVYLPHPSIHPWVKDFVEECAVFPQGRHDDYDSSLDWTEPILSEDSRAYRGGR